LTAEFPKRAMLASDLIIDVRASRTISAEQVGQLERMIFAGGAPSLEQLDLLLLLDTYMQRPDPRWADLLARAAHEVLERRKGSPTGALTEAA
jgi:hypothetical protein